MQVYTWRDILENIYWKYKILPLSQILVFAKCYLAFVLLQAQVFFIYPLLYPLLKYLNNIGWAEKNLISHYRIDCLCPLI